MKTMLFHWVPFFLSKQWSYYQVARGGGEVVKCYWYHHSSFPGTSLPFFSINSYNIPHVMSVFFFSFGQWRVWEEKLQKDSGLRKGRHRQPGDIRGTVVLRARNQWKQPRRRLSVSSAGSKSDLVRLSEVIKPEIYQTPPVTSFSRNPRESSHTEYESSLSLNLISRLKQF